jgi:hypothetical protein
MAFETTGDLSRLDDTIAADTLQSNTLLGSTEIPAQGLSTQLTEHDFSSELMGMSALVYHGLGTDGYVEGHSTFMAYMYSSTRRLHCT